MPPELAEFNYLTELDDQSAASAIWGRYDALRHAWYRGLMSFAEFRTATRRYYDMVTWWNGRADWQPVRVWEQNTADENRHEAMVSARLKDWQIQ